jgi:hypothetical protein
MRVRCQLWALLALGILALSSCVSPPQNLKPPLREEYILPPADDPRFSMPPQYPKETLDSGTPKKDPGKLGDKFGGPGAGRMGMGPGAGGY